MFVAKRRLNPNHSDWTTPTPSGALPPPPPNRGDGERDRQKIFISEDLTKRRASLLWYARNKKRASPAAILGCWSTDGQILLKNARGNIVPANTVADIDNMSG